MRHNRRFRWVAIPIAATLAIVLAGCTQAQLHGFLPGFVEGQQPVTNHTDRISGLWVTSWIVLLIVGIIVWGLILWAVVVYRRRKGQTGLPVQLAEDPLSSVVLGAGKMLSDFELLRRISLD